MYERFFGLNEKPFSITPDPRYLYLTKRHAEALAHLLYGVTESGGFVQLTGEVGTGKTTLVRSLLEQVPGHVEVALILNPRLSPNEFLHAICDEVGAVTPPQASPKELVDALNRHLLEAHARGSRVVLIVDEAQNLSAEVLEQVRLLTNLETAKQKLLQIILIGQTELRDLLARNDLRQLAQRITGRYHLDPLHRDETGAYVRHRLKVAGCTTDVMRPSALSELHRISGGVPRSINVIGDRAMLGAYTREQRVVNGALVREAASEVLGRRIRPRWMPLANAAAVLATLAVISAGLWQARQLWPDPAVEAGVAATPAATASQPGNARVDSIAIVEPADADPAAATRGNIAREPLDDAPPQPLQEPGQEPAPDPVAFPPSLADLLAAHGGHTGTDSAFGGLFGLWGADYQPGRETGCNQARAQGLDCLFQRGSWRSLITLDLPAVLSLRDEAGADFQVVLAGLDETRAQLLLAGESHPVSLLELSGYWDGEFLMLWRPLSQSGPDMAPGYRGPEVPALRRALSRVDGKDGEAADAQLFDPSLAERVRAFQRMNRLEPDGIIGARTQIVLGTVLGGAASPTLSGSR